MKDWRWQMGTKSIMAGLMLGGMASPAIAAERVVFSYLTFERSIAVEDLVTFAESGELSDDLEGYINQTGKEPEEIQRALNRPVPVRATLLDRTLNTFLGELLLDEVGTFVRTSSDTANREALRAALVLSASDDDQVSLIEFIQNYPTEEVHIEGDRVVSAYYELSVWSDRAQELMDLMGSLGDEEE